MHRFGQHRGTVLVVDDNEIARRLCKRVLEKVGYSVLLASDGRGAVSLALASSPDVILLDDAMPGMSSLVAMRLIKRKIRSISIVITTMDPYGSNRERYVAAGADYVMTWPLLLKDLISVIGKFAPGPGSAN